MQMHPIKRQLIVGFTIIALITLAILFVVKEHSLTVFDFPTQANTGGKSLEEMWVLKKPVYCTFSDARSKVARQGQFFTFNGWVYMSVYGIDKKQVTFFLNNGDTVYTWKSTEKTGRRYIFENDTVYRNGVVEIDLAEVVNAICVKKVIDATQFLLPPGITF